MRDKIDIFNIKIKCNIILNYYLILFFLITNLYYLEFPSTSLVLILLNIIYSIISVIQVPLNPHSYIRPLK